MADVFTKAKRSEYGGVRVGPEQTLGLKITKTGDGAATISLYFDVGENVRVAERRLNPPSRAFQVSLRDTPCLPCEPWAEAHGYRHSSRWDDLFHSL